MNNTSLTEPTLRSFAAIPEDPQVRHHSRVYACRGEVGAPIPPALGLELGQALAPQLWEPLAKPETLFRRAVVPNASVRDSERNNSEEFVWLSRHAAELSQYRGEWLLIRGSVLLAHGTQIAELKRLIAEQEIKSPFLYYVPKEEESRFIF